MPKEQATKKVTIRLYEADIETLKTFFPTTGYNVAIRHTVNKLCRALRQKDAEGAQPRDVNIDIPLD